MNIKLNFLYILFILFTKNIHCPNKNIIIDIEKPQKITFETILSLKNKPSIICEEALKSGMYDVTFLEKNKRKIINQYKKSFSVKFLQEHIEKLKIYPETLFITELKKYFEEKSKTDQRDIAQLCLEYWQSQWFSKNYFFDRF